MLQHDSTRYLSDMLACNRGPTRAFQRLADELKQRRAPQALFSCSAHITLTLLLGSHQVLNHSTVAQRLRPEQKTLALGSVQDSVARVSACGL